MRPVCVDVVEVLRPTTDFLFELLSAVRFQAAWVSGSEVMSALANHSCPHYYGQGTECRGGCSDWNPAKFLAVLNAYTGGRGLLVILSGPETDQAPRSIGCVLKF